MQQKRVLKGQKETEVFLLRKKEKIYAKNSGCCEQEDATSNLYGILEWQAT